MPLSEGNGGTIRRQQNLVYRYKDAIFVGKNNEYLVYHEKNDLTDAPAYADGS